MLPDGAAPFHAHAGILLDDAGHAHDLARLVEEVLARVDAPVPEDALAATRDFFAFHLQRYSKSRRSAHLLAAEYDVRQLHAVGLLPQPDQPDVVHRHQRLRRSQAPTSRR